MTKDEAARLTKNYIADHVVRLKVDSDRCCLCTKIDEEDWLCSPALHEDKPPFKILCYAYNNPGKKITRDELFKKGNVDIRNKYLKTQVFSDNRAVRTLIQTPLLELDKDYILFRKVVKLTSNKIAEFRKSFKI